MTGESKKRLCIAGIVGGALIGCGAPVIGLAGTVMGMMKAFNELGSQGVGDPTKLSASIGEVLISTIVGVVLMIPGFILMIVSIIFFRKLERQIKSSSSDAAP